MLNSKSNSSRPEGWLPAGYSVPLALTARQERYCRRAVDINRFVYNLCVATHRFCRSNKLRWPSRSSLESTRTLSGDMLMKAGFRQSGPRRDRAGTTLTPSCGNPEMPRSSATAGSAAPGSATTSPGRSPSWEKLTEKLTPAPKSFPTPVSGSTSGERDLSPYWSDFTEAISSELWLPTETGSDSSSSSGLPNRTAAGSWFSTTRITAPSRNSPRIFSPSCTPSVAGCTACAATATQSRRIRVYPTGDQRRTLRLWFDAARWCCNEAVARLRRTGEPANWKAIKTEIIHAVPERLRAAPYEVKSISVRDDCRAVSEVRRRNRSWQCVSRLNRPKFRSRKAPRQCFASAVSQAAYHTILGQATRRIWRQPADPVRRNDAKPRPKAASLRWTPAYDLVLGNRRRPHRRLRQGASALIWSLLSRAKLERRRLAKRNKYRAASRMRVRIGNLTDELHHQAARWLVDNFDVILLPTFETSDMARRGARKLRSKSVRSLLTYAHYRFQKFLTWKAWQVGKELVLVNEAYTSKTCSWSGEIIPNLGGRRAVAGSDGVRVDRDINGARGIFLRTLGDTPALRQAAQEYIGNCAVSVS